MSEPPQRPFAVPASVVKVEPGSAGSSTTPGAPTATGAPAFVPKAPAARRRAPVAKPEETAVDLLAGPQLRVKRPDPKDKKSTAAQQQPQQVRVAFSAPARAPSSSKQRGGGSIGFVNSSFNPYDDDDDSMLGMGEHEGGSTSTQYPPTMLPFPVDEDEKPWRDGWTGPAPVGLPAYKDPSLPDVAAAMKRMNLGSYSADSGAGGGSTFGTSAPALTSSISSSTSTSTSFSSSSSSSDLPMVKQESSSSSSSSSSATPISALAASMSDAIKMEPSPSSSSSSSTSSSSRAPPSAAALRELRLKLAEVMGVRTSRSAQRQAELVSSSSSSSSVMYEGTDADGLLDFQSTLTWFYPPRVASATAEASALHQQYGPDVSALEEGPAGELMVFQLPSHLPIAPVPMSQRRGVGSSTSAQTTLSQTDFRSFGNPPAAAGGGAAGRGSVAGGTGPQGASTSTSTSSSSAGAGAGAAGAGSIGADGGMSESLVHDDPMIVDDASVRTSLSALALASQYKVFVPQTENNIKNLPQGQIGKLVIHKSGKVRLMIGETALEVTAGITPPFLQELVSISASSRGTNDLHFLGPISKHAVCSIDVDHILARAGKGTTAK